MIPAVVIVLLCVPIASRIEPLVPEEGGEEGGEEGEEGEEEGGEEGEEGGESHLYEYADHHSVHSIQHTTPHTAHRTPYTAPDNSGLSRFFSSFLLLFSAPLLSCSSLLLFSPALLCSSSLLLFSALLLSSTYCALSGVSHALVRSKRRRSRSSTPRQGGRWRWELTNKPHPVPSPAGRRPVSYRRRRRESLPP